MISRFFNSRVVSFTCTGNNVLCTRVQLSCEMIVSAMIGGCKVGICEIGFTVMANDAIWLCQGDNDFFLRDSGLSLAIIASRVTEFTDSNGAK